MHHAVPSILSKLTTPSQSKILSIFIHEEIFLASAHVRNVLPRGWSYFVSHNAVRNVHSAYARNKMADTPTVSKYSFNTRFNGQQPFFVREPSFYSFFIDLNDKRLGVLQPWGAMSKSRGSSEKHQSHTVYCPSPTQITNAQTKWAYIQWITHGTQQTVFLLPNCYKFIFGSFVNISFILLYNTKYSPAVMIYIFNIISRHHLTAISSIRLTPFYDLFN